MTRVSALVAALGLLLLGAGSPQNAAQNAAQKKKHKVHRAKAHLRRAAPIPLTHAPNSPAERYARLTPSECLAQLGARKIQYLVEPRTRGVEIPVRIPGPLNGVLYRTDFPDRERGKVPWEIFDCRLVLSLDDFGATLRAHSIVEVRIFSCFRPPPKSFPANEVGKRHEGALAVDVREFRKEDGTALNVLEQFNGKLGATLCGPGAVPPNPDSAEARELHEIACAAADSHLFNSVLTPNYNPPHKNHFHLELTPHVDWFMLR
ncbi:MAG TPA: extensin family protein [Polyangiaceae bacterium]|nr:extensin family protein [Polyangiaceae bacterium]